MTQDQSEGGRSLSRVQTGGHQKGVASWFGALFARHKYGGYRDKEINLPSAVEGRPLPLFEPTWETGSWPNTGTGVTQVSCDIATDGTWKQSASL